LLGLLAKEKLKRIKYQLILLPFHPLKWKGHKILYTGIQK
jgi:hypothetical protein